MRSIPCSIDIIRSHREECWIISIPADSAGNAAVDCSDLLTGKRKNMIFADRKTEFIITSGFAACNGRQIPITKIWLECLHHLFSDIHTDHIDYDFSDWHGDVSITVRIT